MWGGVVRECCREADVYRVGASVKWFVDCSRAMQRRVCCLLVCVDDVDRSNAGSGSYASRHVISLVGASLCLEQHIQPVILDDLFPEFWYLPIHRRWT